MLKNLFWINLIIEELEIIETIKKIIINFELLINKDFSSFKNNF